MDALSRTQAFRAQFCYHFGCVWIWPLKRLGHFGALESRGDATPRQLGAGAVDCAVLHILGEGQRNFRPKNFSLSVAIVWSQANVAWLRVQRGQMAFNCGNSKQRGLQVAMVPVSHTRAGCWLHSLRSNVPVCA